MSARWLALVVLALMVAQGCSSARRRHDAYQELLDAEKRYLEDQLYELDYQYGVLKEKYHSAVRENDSLRGLLEERRLPGGVEDAVPGEPLPGAEALRPPINADGLTPPEIDLGEPMPPEQPPQVTPPGELLPERPSSPAPETIPSAPPTEDYPTGRNKRSGDGHENLADPRVTHLHLNPLLTGGADLDGHPGDDGVAVAIEPRNAANQYVAVAGPISLVVIDPAKQNEQARVARWDFNVHETREMLSRSVFGKGIQLQLPWPHASPDNPRLRLFVRYTTPEGIKLEADREIFVELPGQVSRRWTPLATREQSPPPQSAPGVEPSATVSPPPGSTVSEQADRPQWRPHR